MKNFKFFILLNTLEEPEVGAFYKYLKQVHGGEKVALKVFTYIRKFSANFGNDKKIDVDLAYRKMFQPNGSGNGRRKILDALSDLHLWLKDFLIKEKLAQNPLEMQIVWFNILRERGLEEELSKQISRFYTDNTAANSGSSANYLQDMIATYLQYQNLNFNRSAANMDVLIDCMERLEAYAEIFRLQMACQIANFKKMAPATKKRAVQNGELATKRLQNMLLLPLFRKIHELIQNEEMNCYLEIEKMLLDYAGQLDPNELHGILGYLHNYAAIQSRKGNENVFLEKTHQLNKIGLQYGFFDRNNGLSTRQFANVLSVAYSVKDFAWASTFLQLKIEILPEDIRPDMIRLAKAMECFARDDFEQTLTILDAVSFTDVHHIIRVRVMMLKSYLHVKRDADKIMAYCLAFEAQLVRHRKPGTTEAIEAALAFIKVIKMLLLEKETRQGLIDHIKKTPNLYSKIWLLEYSAGYKPRFAPANPKSQKSG